MIECTLNVCVFKLCCLPERWFQNKSKHISVLPLCNFLKVLYFFLKRNYFLSFLSTVKVKVLSTFLFCLVEFLLSSLYFGNFALERFDTFCVKIQSGSIDISLG